MSLNETGSNCLRITVTENGCKLWSVTFTGGELMDNNITDEILYNCSNEYSNLKTKKARGGYIDFFAEKIKPIIYPARGELSLV